jgi:hypothetical protein
MVVIFCDLDDVNMSLNVLEHVLTFRNVVSLQSYIKKESIGQAIFVQIYSYFNHK